MIFYADRDLRVKQSQGHSGCLVVITEEDSATEFNQLFSSGVAEKTRESQRSVKTLNTFFVDPGNQFELISEFFKTGLSRVGEQIRVGVCDKYEFIAAEQRLPFDVILQTNILSSVKRLDRLIEGKPTGRGDRKQGENHCQGQ